VKPVVVDLYCGAGGAAMGWHRAGWDVVGVDHEPQPDYPFEFHQDDARDFFAANWRSFEAAHASPPCQASTALTKGTNKGREYVDHIPETRRLLHASGLPSVIENVQGAAVRPDLTLCGEMFGLDVIRHRYFELDGFLAMQPEHVPHRGRVRGWRQDLPRRLPRRHPRRAGPLHPQLRPAHGVRADVRRVPEREAAAAGGART
jgi:site-specific DNA-cytosine methylase